MNRIRYIHDRKGRYASKRVFRVGDNSYRVLIDVNDMNESSYSYQIVEFRTRTTFTSGELFTTMRQTQDAVKKALEGLGVSFEKEERNDKGKT